MKKLAATALALLSTAAPASAAIDARLQGTFTMQGHLTVAVDVRGEHRGAQITRTWTFTPSCATGVCDAVTLVRDRSPKHIPDMLVLERTGPGVYVGRGKFSVALFCAGRVRPHGGVALEKITVRITQVQTVGTTAYATALSASYVNPKRINNTRCPGGIGHDAAVYTGQLSSALPTS
jgi:hypothetical protein